MSILEHPLLSRIRRNHGLEHATITLLSQRFPRIPLAGYSFPGGFLIVGDVPTEILGTIVEEALTRLNHGESRLAIHPRCGTNLLTTGLLAGLFGWLGTSGARSRKERVERLPLVILLVMLGVMVGQSLGPVLQERITTSGNPQGLQVVHIVRSRLAGLTIHRVVTEG